MFNQKEHLKKISKQIDECECLICKKKFIKQSGLSLHLKFLHKISAEEYFDKYFPDVNKICPCGNKKKFISIKHGYQKYCNGKCPQRNKGENNSMFKSTRTEEWKKKHSEFMKGNKYGLDNHSLKGAKRNFSEEHKNNIRKHLKRLNERGFENKGGRCKWYEYKESQDKNHTRRHS